MRMHRIYPGALLARYHALQVLLERSDEDGVVAGQDLPRFLTPVVKAQEVLREAGVQRVFVEDVHAALWYASRFPDTPLERALEEIDFILRWRMVQPEVGEEVWEGIRSVFGDRPAVFSRFEELKARREALEAWLGEDRLDLPALFLEASRHVTRPDAVKVGFEHRFVPEALGRFLDPFPAGDLPSSRSLRVIHARIYPRTEAEAHAVARHLRDHPPAHPHRVVVALGSPGLFPLVERVFADYGIPFVRPGGPPLAAFPVFHILDAAVAFLEYARPGDTGVPEHIIRRLADEPALDPGKVEQVRQKLNARFSQRADSEGRVAVSDWVGLLDTWMHEVLLHVDHPRFREARERATRLLEELRFAVEAGGDPRLSPPSFRLLLHRFARKFRVPEEDAGGGVWLASFPDQTPLEGDRLYVLGLSEHALPRYPYHPWIPLRHVHRFGWPPPQVLYEKQIRGFQRLLQGYGEVWLSASRMGDEDRQVAPSPTLLPYLEEAPRDPSPGPVRVYLPEGKGPLPELPEEGVVLSGKQREAWVQRLRKEGLRVTDLVTYARCPFRFYLSVVEGVEEIELPEALPSRLDVGDLFHRVYEAALKSWEGRDMPSPDAILRSVKEVLPAFLTGSPLEQVMFREEVMALAEAMAEMEKAFVEMGYRRLVSLEGAGQAEVEGIPIRGRWDRVMAREDGEELVVDYKTGSVPRNRSQSAAMLQLEAYVAMRKRAETAVFLYPRERGMVWLEPNREFVLSEVMERIREGVFPTTDAPDEMCRSCPFNRICPVGREHMPSWR